MIKQTQRILSILALTLISSHAFAHHLVVKYAWIPEAPPVTPVMAAFMEIENHSNHPAEIVSISGQDFDRVEMHLSKEENGIARMIPQKKLIIPAKGKLVLQHGGYHLMLFNPKRRLKDGDTTELVMKLASGNSFTVKLIVEKTTMMMDHSNH